MKVCLQMYSAREYMHSFPLEALHRCAEIYNFLELPAPLLDDKLGIYYGHGISEWKKEIERTGKKVIGGYLRTETDTWDVEAGQPGQYRESLSPQKKKEREIGCAWHGF